MHEYLGAQGIESFSLYDYFDHTSPGLHFENDPHWNEEANKLAAVHLLRWLLDELGMEPVEDSFIEQGLFEYYGSLDSPRISERLIRRHKPLSTSLRNSIRLKYQELEFDVEAQVE
jgi:hypothetical protein